MLWDIAYGLCHEALHLDSLEDFNATEADLMGMKDDILAMWKSRDMQGKLRPLDPHSSHPWTPRDRGLPWGELLFPEGLLHPAVPSVALVVAQVRCHCHSSGLWPHHPGFPQCLDSCLTFRDFCPPAFLWWECQWSTTLTP